MSTKPHTRASLGVPDWFICDGCTHSPDSHWLTPPCNRHDWDYFLGGRLSSPRVADEARAHADRDLRAAIKHNAKYYPGSWFDRLWRPPVGEIYYLAVTRFGGPSFRLWTDDEWESLLRDPRILAIHHGKYDPRGDENFSEVYAEWEAFRTKLETLEAYDE